MFYRYDPTMILLLAGVILSAIAQIRVSSAYNKYSRVANQRGLRGADVARMLLQSQGIYDVTINSIPGNLTDHYDPRTKTLNLSQGVYGGTSVASLGVAAHECGHAMQHNEGYAPLAFRNAIVPVVNFASNLSWPVIMLGIIFGGFGSTLCQIGIILFSAAVIFQLVTLPVEFNASSRALKLLDSQGFLVGDENKGARKVLSAAALTYVAAAVTSILQLLRLILLFGDRDRN